MRALLSCILVLLLAAPALAGETLVLSYGGTSLSLGSLRVLKTAYARLGVEVRGKLLPAARALQMAEEGLVDGEVNRIAAIEKQYPHLIRIDVPINMVEGVILTCGDTPEGMGPDLGMTLDDVRARRVGIKIGNRYAEIIADGLHQVTRLPDENKLLSLLLAGRLDALLVDRAWAESVAARPGMECLHISLPPLVVTPLYHYLNDRHADLAPRITGMLRAMRDSGEIEDILRTDLPH